MVNLKEYGLSKKLKKLEDEHLPNIEELKIENESLLKKEAEFVKKFKLKGRNHAKGKQTRK